MGLWEFEAKIAENFFNWMHMALCALIRQKPEILLTPFALLIFHLFFFRCSNSSECIRAKPWCPGIQQNYVLCTLGICIMIPFWNLFPFHLHTFCSFFARCEHRSVCWYPFDKISEKSGKNGLSDDATIQRILFFI